MCVCVCVCVDELLLCLLEHISLFFKVILFICLFLAVPSLGCCMGFSLVVGVWAVL